MIEIDPDKRISVEDALDHEFFDGVRVMHMAPYDEPI